MVRFLKEEEVDNNGSLFRARNSVFRDKFG